jgi:putative ABC transport system permease protein
MPDSQMPSWDSVVRRHARAAGISLSTETLAELATHLEDLHAAGLASGLSDADARSRALTALEASPLSTLSARPDPRANQARVLDEMARAHATSHRSFAVTYALRMALRQFRQHPAFSLVVVLVLGLGIGASAAVYTVVDSVVLRPLPYRQPDRLVTLWDTNYEKGVAHDPISPVNFMDDRALPVFTDAAAWWRPDVNLVDPGLDPVRVRTIETSGNLFELLGVHPQLGPGFPADGPLFSSDLMAVISDRLWRTRYAADPGIIGRQLRFNDTPYTIVGVMPAKFAYPGDIDVWERLRWDMTKHSRAAHFMEGVARLAPGVDLARAITEVDALAARLDKEFPATYRAWGVRLVPLLDDQLGYYRPALAVLFGAVGLLLVIGCLNVASLLLTRALAREREMAVRAALGASPRQVTMQLLAESLVLSGAGALAGLFAAYLTLPLLVAATPVSIPRLDEAVINGRVLGFVAAVSAGTTLLFGLVPTLLLLRRRHMATMRSGERGSTRGARRLYLGLVAGELALACALVVSSALLVRTVQSLMAVPIGVDADDTLTASIQITQTSVPACAAPRRSNDLAAIVACWTGVATVQGAVLDRIREAPGVSSAGWTNFLPLETGWRVLFSIEGQPPARAGEEPQAQFHSVSDGYFEAMGARITSGRAFLATDTAGAAPVVVVNESFARRYLADREATDHILNTPATGIGPLGVNLKAGQRFAVVGVVADIRNTPIGQPVEPAVYFEARQFPFTSMFVAVRGRDRDTALTAIRTALHDVTPTTPIGKVETWGDHMLARTAEPRMLRTILVFFGALAGLLAALGVYGLFSWSVAVRRRELAIRLTLGAQRSHIAGLVVRQSALLTLVGLVCGWGLVQLGTGALARVLYRVSPNDPGATSLAIALLLTVALVACIPPAIRAMRVELVSKDD